MKCSEYEQKLLEGWEEIYKKGQLTLWILLALKAGEKHMTQIKACIADLTGKILIVDDKSMYRALRRFKDAELISFRTIPSKGGPELKLYFLTTTGKNVLQIFIERNITEVFYKKSVTELLKTN